MFFGESRVPLLFTTVNDTDSLVSLEPLLCPTPHAMLFLWPHPKGQAVLRGFIQKSEKMLRMVPGV